MANQSLTAIALNGTLKATDTGGLSSTEQMLDLICNELEKANIATKSIRLADHNIKPGVRSDEGDGDAWPAIRDQILEADIVIVGSPVWLGQPSSIIKRALERMDAFLSEKDEGGRMVSYNRVGLVAVVGNEDGAHHVSAELYQALNDVGFALAPNAVSYWVGEAMSSTDFGDLDVVPETVMTAARMATRNAVHLARLLKAEPFGHVL